MNVSTLLPSGALSADRAATLVRQCSNEIQGATLSIQADDYDSPWKDILERYLADFLAFFFPHAHTAIDWSLGYTFLDKELQAVLRDAELRRRLADKLVQVWRRDGQESWVLIHIEEKNVTYITSVEQLGREEGLKVGRAEGFIDGITLALEIRFGDAAATLIAEIRQITDLAVLEQVLTSVRAATTPDDVRRVYAPTTTNARG